jgi:AcrR family transcriptional regulator
MAVDTERKRVVKRPEDRRQDILDAAVRVLRTRGPGDATVSDITEAAGVAKGTFYLYFDSKEHLFAALRERFVEDALARGADLLQRVGKEDWWGLVDASLESFIDFHFDRREETRLLVGEGWTPDVRDLLDDCDRKLTRIFAAGIEAGVEAGVFDAPDPEMTAIFLHHAVEGALEDVICFCREIDRDRLFAAARELAHKVLA